MAEWVKKAMPAANESERCSCGRELHGATPCDAVRFTLTSEATVGTPTVVHLVTQRGQPYGSVRRCCERCGEYGRIAAGSGDNGHTWIDDPVLFEKLPEGFVTCDAWRR